MKENARKALHSEYFLRIESTEKESRKKKYIIHLHRVFKFYMLDFGEDNDEVRSYFLRKQAD